MKVILLQDVAKIGKRYEEATVPDGYAMNMLIPKGLAEAATPENRKKIAASKANQVASAVASDATFTQAVQALTTSPLSITAAANDQGHLFEAIKAEAIVTAATTAGVTLQVEQIKIETPIKEVGEQGITLVSGEAQTTITINVIAA